MSIWATFFDLEDNPPGAYQGSHILPSEADVRVASDEAPSLAQVPSHITRDGRDDQPEDGQPWPWLRFSLGVEDQVLDRGQVEQLHAALGAWLERTGDQA
ncbi:hypothetical protein [Streptomyces sp. WAC 04229]|uniref:hypothetical protein n=1 Tax=Streptomyces sp. WAC 04229 TaxID=2203206 RepID=UPI00163B90CA|nr:hypothetical protein [Streptomyces sp. WAC 04229]